MSTSRKYYIPGDLVYLGKPFMKVMKRELWDKVCAMCVKGTGELKFCKGCGVMKYCDKKCQKEGWCYHKFECSLLPKYSKVADNSEYQIVQMIGNVIMKLKGKEWKSVTAKALGEEVSFDDLKIPPVKVENDCFPFIFSMFKTKVQTYIGEENLPDDDQFALILRKVVHNQFSHKENNFDVAALDIGISKFGLSCVPNCAVSFDRKTVSIKCMKMIQKDTEQLTVSLIPLVNTINPFLLCASTNRHLKETQPCINCQKPYGTSPLTKILDVPKSCKVIEESELTLKLAALLVQMKYPVNIISQQKLRQLLQKQKGVLGDSNILRIRILSLKCLYMNGPVLEMRNDLVKLIEWMRSTWGDNFPELGPVYIKLLDVSLKLNDISKVVLCQKELLRLYSICEGVDIKLVEEIEMIIRNAMLVSFPLAAFY